MKKNYPLLLIALCSFYISSAQTHQLWGMSSAGGGVDSGGTVFMLNLDGSGFNVTHSFDSLSGFEAYGSLVQAPNGSFYGMTSNGGLYNAGVIFHYDQTLNMYSKDYDFDYTYNGGTPQSTLTPDTNGLLYGMATGGGINSDGTLFSFEPNTATFIHLYDFVDSVGRNPYGYLLQGPMGKLYGLTSEGGIDSVGTLFKYDIGSNTINVLHHFTHATGDNPNGSLLQANNDKLYGMTSNGGSNSLGVIFSFNPADSTYTDIYDFDGATGANPYGSLIQGSDNLLYGMTANGGAYGYGNIFNYDPVINALTDLFDFNGGNGSAPEGELMQASNGKLYGTTSFGGNFDNGVAFSFDQTNMNYINLHDFNTGSGERPWADLIEITITGVTEKNALQNIQLYPNPVSDQLIVKSYTLLGKSTITIFNALSQKLLSLPVGDGWGEAFDVSSLSPGIYFIQLTNDNGSCNGKFVKE